MLVHEPAPHAHEQTHSENRERHHRRKVRVHRA
jgi:hypothetical protein